MNFITEIDKLLCRIINKLGIRNSHFTRNEFLLRDLNRKIKDFPLEKYNYPTHFEQGKNIWVFWAQGKEKMPLVIQQCYKSIIRNKGNYSVVLLDMDSIAEYITLPEYIYKKHREGKISFAHLSDIIRFSLLSEYGGYYMDATLYLTKKIEQRNSLYTIKHKPSNEYISKNLWTGFFWYMPKGHPIASFLQDYLYEYWKTHDIIFDYFFVDFLIRIFYEKNKTFHEEIERIRKSNPFLYFFQSNLCEEPYSNDNWEKICSDTSIFKLNWKENRKDNNRGFITTYGVLANGLLH